MILVQNRPAWLLTGIMMIIMILIMIIMIITIIIIMMMMVIIPPAGLVTVTGLPGPPVQSSPIPFSQAVYSDVQLYEKVKVISFDADKLKEKSKVNSVDEDNL